MQVTLFFTYDTSLKEWDSAGILSRELSIYKKLHNENNIKFNFITYGNAEDLKIDIGEGIKVYPLYKNAKKSNYKFVKIFKSLMIPLIFKDIIRNSSILKTNQLKGCWVGLISKTLFKKPLIVRTGYDALKWSKFEMRGKIYTFLIKLLTKTSLIFSNQYNVSTLSDKNFLSEEFKVKDKIKIRPNYIDQETFKDFRLQRDDELLFVGRLEEQKNIRFLINEYKHYELPRLNIIGEGSYKEELINEITKHNLNINFIGKVLNQELPNLYNKFKFFILCSKYEGNPKTLLEAMSSGSIVIGSNVEGINSIIKNKQNGFLINSKIGDLEKVFKLILSGQINLNEIKQNAEHYISQNHSLEMLTKIELQDYDKHLRIKSL